MSTSIIGVDYAHFAKLTNEETKTYEEPKRLDPIQEIKVEPETNTTSQYGDNRAVETVNAMGAITLTVTFTGISPENDALLLGHTIDKTKKKVSKRADDIAPYGAFVYRRMRADGGFRYKVLYKGTFARPAEETKTKEDQVEFSGQELTASFMPLAVDGGLFEYYVDAAVGDKATENAWKTGVVFPDTVTP
ncbi:hypothetical protein PSYJYH_000055 [Bacillus phage PSYJ-YH]|nr:hypothetical protein PSYJYH_000055 [Bacillus phage PSYJ-YH]